MTQGTGEAPNANRPTAVSLGMHRSAVRELCALLPGELEGVPLEALFGERGAERAQPELPPAAFVLCACVCLSRYVCYWSVINAL